MTSIPMIIAVERIDIPRLILDVKSHVTFEDPDVRAGVLDLRIKETMSAAPTIELKIHDPEYKLLDSPLLWEFDRARDRVLREIRVEIERHGFIMANAQWSAASSGTGVDLTLVFEHEVAYYMKKHRGAKKMQRGRVTLAEFMLTLAREIKEVPVRFISPELHRANPIQAATRAERREVADARLQPGLPSGAAITVKHVRASPIQVRTTEAILRAGQALGCRRKLLVVGQMTITQESDGGAEPGTSSRFVGPFQQESRYGTVAQRKDPYHAATAFFRLAMAIDRRSPNLSYADLAERVQISGQGSLYAPWKDEAERTVRTFLGSGGESSIIYYKAFNYERRGEESTWTCSQRWAGVVNWRSFVRGYSEWVFASEPDLFKARPQMILNREDEREESGIRVEGDFDRQKPVQTLTIQTHVAKWKAPAGSVVEVRGYGPGDGRWLVEEIERSYFHTETEITLKRPAKPLPEPRAELVKVSLGLGSTGLPTQVVAAYREAYTIDQRNYPYVWGGGHSAAGQPSGGGYDCSGYVTAILAAGELGFHLGGPTATSIDLESWGAGGQGRFFTVWANSQHTWIQWHIEGAKWRADTSPHGDGPNGPHLRGSARETAGFVARHWPGF